MAAIYMPAEPTSIVKITVATDRYPSRQQWTESIKEWASNSDIKLVWLGESTTVTRESRWHQSLWHIADPQARTMFLLRWSS